MQIKELTTDQCRALLQATNLGRLACVRDNRPYIVPIYYDYYKDAALQFRDPRQKDSVDADESTCVCGG